MRRAIQQGHRIGIEPGFLPRYVDVVTETMGAAYPELHTERERILKWVRAEEEGFGRTLEQGLRLLEDRLRAGTLDAAAAFQLHDTYGFPFEMTTEVAAEQGVELDPAAFGELMDAQRARSAGGGARERVGAAGEAIRDLGEPTEFVGYEKLAEHTVARVAERDGRTLVKLASSPFYAQGGGQVSDTGVVEVEGDGGGSARVVDVLRSARTRRSWSTGRCPTARGCARWSTVPRAWPRRPTTPRPICSTRRCARRSATTQSDDGGLWSSSALSPFDAQGGGQRVPTRAVHERRAARRGPPASWTSCARGRDQAARRLEGESADGLARAQER
jgi:hypothetical protein